MQRYWYLWSNILGELRFWENVPARNHPRIPSEFRVKMSSVSVGCSLSQEDLLHRVEFASYSLLCIQCNNFNILCWVPKWICAYWEINER